MTTITLPRATVEQVLEALEQSETTVPYEGFGMSRRVAERKHQATITALRAALAQQDEPVQEPVAIADGTFNHDCPIGTLLYTAPPRQKPLTEDEIPALAEQVLKLSVYYDVWALLGTDGLVALVRAVEQAHGIKE